MLVEVKKSFLKQLAGLPKDIRSRIEDFVFEELPKFESIGQSGKIEKMHGYKFCYKIRFGNYRVGLVFQDDVVTVKVVMHRSEIYRFSP